MPIVDAQIHTWGTGLPSNLSHWQITQFTPEQAIALMDAGGVDAAVIHPPGWDPNSTEMAFKAARDYPGRFAIIGSLPLEDQQSRARIATGRGQPGMLWLRFACLHQPLRQWLQKVYLWSLAPTRRCDQPPVAYASRWPAVDQAACSGCGASPRRASVWAVGTPSGVQPRSW